MPPTLPLALMRSPRSMFTQINRARRHDLLPALLALRFKPVTQVRIDVKGELVLRALEAASGHQSASLRRSLWAQCLPRGVLEEAFASAST